MSSKSIFVTLSLGILVVDTAWFSINPNKPDEFKANSNVEEKPRYKAMFVPSEIDETYTEMHQIHEMLIDATKFKPSKNFPFYNQNNNFHKDEKNYVINDFNQQYFNQHDSNQYDSNKHDSNQHDSNEHDFNQHDFDKDNKRRNNVNDSQTYKPIKGKGQRFLEVFEVVEFDHVPCTSTSGLEGTCFHEYDCQNFGGSVMGSCADGIGTCCVITFGCDSSSAATVGWFTNPDFPLPSSERLSCSITIEKASEKIKQIRLDFMIFETLPPTYGTCEQDQFLVTGQDLNNVIPILCGINTGQHIYVEVGNTKGPINLSLQTLSEEKRIFAIKVSQLTSSDILAAPKGCLQYFTEPNGHIESFNYRNRTEIGITRVTSYLNNLNYAVCIEREQSSCSITYTNVGEMQIVNYDTDGLPIIPPKQAGVEIFNCPSDWLLIAAVRLCGERLNDGSVLQDFSLDAPVTDDGAGPITVWFRSDGFYAGRGFKLHYQQNSCSSFKD